MAESVFEKDLINEPRNWSLSLRVERDALRAMLYNNEASGSLVVRTIGLSHDSESSYVKALEEAVYDNPLLLADFRRVDVIVDTDRFTIMPADVAADIDTALAVVDAALPGVDVVEETVESALVEQGAVLFMKVPVDVAAFLRRTFNNPAISHHLVPLCRYFAESGKLGNNGRVYVNFRQHALDIIPFGNDTLSLANTFVFNDVADAVYYIMACRDALGLAGSNNEVFVAGNPDVREGITPLLRRYIGYVMPVIFPSAMFKAGKEAMHAPFDLIVLPLCVS